MHRLLSAIWCSDENRCLCIPLPVTIETPNIEDLMRTAATELGLLEVRLVHYGHRLVPSWMEAPPGWAALGQGMQFSCIGEGSDPRTALRDMMARGRDKALRL